jgi:hypothetical protein
VVLLRGFSKTGLAAGTEDAQYYKMASTVEYSNTGLFRGKNQFRSQAQRWVRVGKKPLLVGGKTLRFITVSNVDSPSSFEEFSFVMDKETRARSLEEFWFVMDKETQVMSLGSEGLSLFRRVINECAGALETVTKENIGKTWKQSFNLSSIAGSTPGDMKFTLTAIEVETEKFGKLIAVRALSEPFTVKAVKEDGGVGNIQSKVNTVYVFDAEMDDIYISVSVFDAVTNMNGFKEELRHEVATYKTNAEGVVVDLTGIGKQFENLVRKVGLTNKKMKVVNQVPLPHWAQQEALEASQVAAICASTSCEGAVNPVVTISIPVAQTVSRQSLGALMSVGEVSTVSSMLAQSVPGVGGMKIAVAPAMVAGGGMGTTATIAGATTGGIAAGSGGGGGGGSVASP